MRVAFAGTPAFAAESLRALLQAGHQVPLVLTQPDRPAGRGMKLQPSPVKVLAQERGIPVCQPAGMRLDGRHAQAAQQAHGALQAAAPDLMVVAAYGLILPTWALNLPPLGCVNVHASLLPRWRGAAPIHRAIEAGDTRTGVTLMQMDEGLDTGAMLRLAAEPILPDDTTASLHDRLAALGGRELVHLLAQSTPWPAQPQPEQGVSYAHKIEKAEARLDWRAPAALLARRVRAFDPFPGASLLLDGVVHKVWAARTEAVEGTEAAAAPGTVLSLGEDGLRLRCGEGVLRLLSLQRPGGRRLPVAQWRQGVPLATGDHLPLPDDASA